MSWLWSRTRMGTVEVAAANRKRASANPIPVTARRPVLVPTGRLLDVGSRACSSCETAATAWRFGGVRKAAAIGCVGSRQDAASTWVGRRSARRRAARLAAGRR
jgi:hypothetical protein